MPHILTLVPSFLSHRKNGVGYWFSEILKWLAPCDIRNTVMVARPLYAPGAQPESPGQDFRYFRFPGTVGLPTAGAFLFARVVGQLRELNRSQRIDLVHAHGILPCGHSAMLLCHASHIPYVVTAYECDEPSTGLWGSAGKWSQRISQRVYAESRRVICTNEEVREQVLQRAGRSCRTSVVYNGVDTEVFCPPPEAEEPTNQLLNMSNLRGTQGQGGLIRALANLKSEFPSLSLAIIAARAEGSQIRKLAQDLDVRDRVRLLACQSREQIADAMKSCTIFLAQSGSEDLECAFLQAMSCGRAVIVGRRVGVAEMIQHGVNGFLINPENEKQLELALAMLLREPQRRRNLGVAARNTILDRFTLRQQAENLIRIYRECI